jgi:hypothetical protein
MDSGDRETQPVERQTAMMKQFRLVIHPVMENKRSRAILISYFLIAALSNGALWWMTLRMLKKAGVLIFYQTFQPSWYVGWLTSPILHVAVAVIAVLIGTALTSVYVVGPVKRLEQWLNDWQQGHKLPPFKVRGKDYLYENVASLINRLHDKSASE